jgi:hypothetical protein
MRSCSFDVSRVRRSGSRPACSPLHACMMRAYYYTTTIICFGARLDGRSGPRVMTDDPALIKREDDSY